MLVLFKVTCLKELNIHLLFLIISKCIMAASHKGSYIRKGNVLSWSFKLGNVETGKVCFWGNRFF